MVPPRSVITRPSAVARRRIGRTARSELLTSPPLQQLMIKRAISHLDYVLEVSSDTASIDIELVRKAMAAATVLALSVRQQ